MKLCYVHVTLHELLDEVCQLTDCAVIRPIDLMLIPTNL